MGILSWFNRPKTSTRAIGTVGSIERGFIDAPTRSGVAVNEWSAMGVSAVYCAVNVISQSIGSLPLTLYQRKPSGHVPAEAHPLYPLLAYVPNDEMTAPVFWETFVSHCLLWGNGYAEIERDNSGRAVNLWTVHPRFVQVLRDSDNGQLVYRVTIPQGTPGEKGQAGRTITLAQSDMLHVPGLGDGSGVGYALLKLARENIGFSIAADAYGQAYFKNAGNVGTYLTHPGTLSDAARDNLRKSFDVMYAGVENTGKVALLEEGLQASRQTLSNEAAQYIETREYQIAEVGRMFNITPVKLHSLLKATWANLSVLNTDYWGATCRPWAVKIEAEITRKLLTRDERGKYCPEFDPDELIRGNQADRYAANKVACGKPWMTVNEIRAQEGLPPVEGGDDLSTPAPAPQPADDQGGKPADVKADLGQKPNQQGGTDGN